MRRPASNLALRIYLFGLIQIVLVMLGMFVVLARSQRPPLPFVDTLAFVADTIVATGGDRAKVTEIVGRVHASLHCSVAVYDEGDRLVAGDGRARAPLRRGDAVVVASDLEMPLELGDGRRWRLVFLEAPPVTTPPVFWRWVVVVVLGVGVSSLLFARSLARPLGRLARAAHDFGAGRMDARVHMNRTDELGQVASAFDRMADRMTQALRVEKELLANVSHELRTPLQRIHIAVELAAEGDAATARESLADIAEDLSELERIVEDVLAATRLSLHEGVPTSGASPPIRPQPVDIPSLIAKATSRFRLTRPRRPLRVAIAGDLPTMSVDPILIRRVVDNLLDNAHKYTEDPELEISVAATRGPASLRIEVRDRGVGISPQDLARVFEPFFRADRSRTKATGGLGLGLALARRIVEAHGGTLTLESVVGAGTCARIELPLGRGGDEVGISPGLVSG